MAKAAVAAEVVAPKKKGKMLIILAVVGVLLVGGGVGAFLLLKPAAHKTAGHGDEEGDGEDSKANKPTYLKLEVFTVNLADHESYLQTEIQLMAGSAKVNEKLAAHLPEVRDALIRLLSSKTSEDLAAPEGKDKLAQEIQKQVNEVLGFKSKSKGVKKVLFASFIIQ